MSSRTLFMTSTDVDRLRTLIESSLRADRRDRPYLAVLEGELDDAEVLPPERIPPDVVTMNTQVRLRDGRRTWNITLVYPESANAEQGQISVLAPLGAAMLGRRVGERIEFRVPGGDVRACDILSVTYQPEAAGRASP